MSASHDQHTHTCCHASKQHGPDTAAGETTRATDVGAAAGTSSSPVDGHAHGPDSQRSHGVHSTPGEALIDPVCGMSVKADSPHHTMHEGHDYRFCSAGCRTKFVADPARYLKPVVAVVEKPPAGTQYTCPMHPEIVRDAPGVCPICGMALEPMMPSLDDDENPELTDFRRRFWWTLPLSLTVRSSSARRAAPRTRCRWRS